VTQPPGLGDGARPPRVVLFRANAVDTDSRAKKFALTLARLGYDVHVLSAEEPGVAPERMSPDRRLGPVPVHPVELTHSRREVHRLIVGARRRRQFRLIDPTPPDEYVTQVAELKLAARVSRRRAEALRRPEPDAGPRPPLWQLWWAVLRVVHEVARMRLKARRARWKAQWVVNVVYRHGWRLWDRRRQASARFATTRGVLPEVEDYAASFGRVLDRLEPDVIHAHHPLVLGTAVRAARRRRAGNHPCTVVYDARENFAGIPPQEQGNVRRHAVLVREEARYIRAAEAVITVSEPIADVLAERYRLPRRPAVVLNVPPAPAGPRDAPGGPDHADVRLPGERRPTVREAAGLDPAIPLLVYSGAVSRARGIDVLVEAMALLPGVHLALVTVPFPHPHVPGLLERAAALGAADRIHPLPPVGQDDLLHHLSGADVAVHPMPGGSPNHDQALPNKLFEYLHAGLPLVVADAKLMAQFVRANGLGEVFPSGEAAGLADAVRRVLAPGYPRVPRADLVARHSWQAQEPSIAELYDRIAPVPVALRVDPTDLPHRFPDLKVTTFPVIDVESPAQAADSHATRTN